MASGLYIVTGHVGHGMNTVCHAMGLVSGSSDTVVLQDVYDKMRHWHYFKDLRACYDARDSHRQVWEDTKREYTRYCSAGFGHTIFSYAQVYCGIRSRAELYDLVEAFPGVKVIWVNADIRVGGMDPSLDITPADADIILDNNQTKYDLWKHIGECGLPHQRYCPFMPELESVD